MPLTAAEKKELAELDRLAGQTRQTGLNAAEQQELAELDRLAGQDTRKSTEGDSGGLPDTDTQVIGKLQGSLPIDPKQIYGGAKAPSLQHPLNVQRQKAYDELIKRGKTPEQIKFVLDVKKKIEAPPTLGRTIGGIAGSLAVPAAINLIPGMAALPEEIVTVPMALAKGLKTAAPIIGAGLGGGFGEAAQIALEEKRRLSIGEFAKAFLEEAGYEAGGRSAVRAGKFVLSPFVKRLVPEAAETIEGFTRVGGKYTLTQLDSRFAYSLAEEISRGSFGARQIFQDLAERNIGPTQIYAGQLLDGLVEGGIRLGPTQLGKEFGEGITRPRGRIFQLLNDLFEPGYAQLDELGAVKTARVFGDVETPSKILDRLGRPITTTKRKVVGEKVTGRLSKGFEELEQFVSAPTASTRPLKRFALKQLQENKALLKKGAKAKALLLTPAGKEYMETLLNMKNDLAHKQMRKFRSKLLKDVRKLSRDVSQDEAVIKRLERLTFEAITDPANTKGFSEEGTRLYLNLGKLYGASREGLEQTFSERLAKRLIKNPTAVTKELFPTNNPTAIKNLRQSLIEPISGRKSAEGKRLWEQLRIAKISEWVDDATKGDIVKSNVFENHVRRMGKEAINEMLPTPAEKKQLNLISSLLHTQGKKPLAGASLFVRGGQVGGAIMMYKGAQEGDFLQVAAGGTLAMGPYFYAKMALHPLGQRLLRSGIALKPGSTSLVPITARLVNLARKIEREELSKVERARRLKRHIKGAPARREARKFGGSF